MRGYEHQAAVTFGVHPRTIRAALGRSGPRHHVVAALLGRPVSEVLTRVGELEQAGMDREVALDWLVLDVH